MSGMVFCFTGTMAAMPRSQGEELVRSLGAAASGSVTKKTTHLVVGADPGASKLTQAAKHGTQVLNEDEFMATAAWVAVAGTLALRTLLRVSDVIAVQAVA